MGWCGCDDRWQVPIPDWYLCSEWTEACRPAVVADWKAQCYHGQESRGDSTKATTSNCGTGCVTKKSKAVGSSSEYMYMCMCMHIVWINWSWHKWRGCKLMWPELPDCYRWWADFLAADVVDGIMYTEGSPSVLVAFSCNWHLPFPTPSLPARTCACPQLIGFIVPCSHSLLDLL